MGNEADEVIVTDAQKNVAIKSPEHLKQWLSETGRRFLVFNALDLVDALPWPGGHEALVQIIMAYRDHRYAVPTGVSVTAPHAFHPGETINVPITKTEFLEIEEMDRAIRDLIGQASAKDPKWSLENSPL